MSQVSQCPSGIVNTTAYIIGMWRDVSSSFGNLFSDAITACFCDYMRFYDYMRFCDYMQSITVMPRQDSPVSILKRSLQLWPPIVVSVPVLGSRGLGDVVDDILFESLLFIIPTARRVCSYPGRAGLSCMLGLGASHLCAEESLYRT